MKYSKLVEWLKRDRDVIAVAFTGSFGMGYQDKWSDLDVLVIISNNSSFQRMAKKYQKLKVEQHPHQSLFKNLKLFAIKLGDLRVDIKTMTKQELLDILKRKRIEDISLFVENIKIVYDPKEFLGNLQKKFKYPCEKGKFELRLVVYPLRVKEFVDIASRRKDYLYLNHIIGQTIESIVKVIYALNSKVYQSLKWAFKDIKKFKLKPRNFEKRMTEILALSNTGTELKRKCSLLYGVGLDLQSRIIKKYPDVAKKIKEHLEWI